MAKHEPCAAGRSIVNTTRLGWGEPCPEDGAIVLLMTDGENVMGYVLCAPHMDDLERAGVVMNPNVN